MKFSIFVLLLYFIQYVVSDGPTVDLQYGKLVGKTKENYLSFESIPYAEAPIGNNRFEPPKQYGGTWKEPRDASKQTHQQCLQYDPMTLNTVGSEDCLYLNVFTPNLDEEKKYPVFVYIHGGAFRSGSDHMFGEDIIMQSGKFVYVSLNFRHGPLGFLSTFCKAIPGNMGLKDQKMALKWIKENIEKFNGDPDQIILAGFSVGGASVHMHLLSKDSENLAKVAISYSGTALNPWAFDYTTPLNKTVMLAKSFNCSMDNGMTVKNCLKKVPANDIVTKGYTLFDKYLGHPLAVFRAVVEPKNVDNAFITDYPENIIKSGNIANIPWLVSRNTDEGGIVAPILLNKNSNGVSNLIEFGKKFDEVVPAMLFYDEFAKADRDMMTSYLKRMYNINSKGELIEDNYWNIQRMMSDELFTNPIEDSIKLQREFSKSKVYYYIYDNPPPYGYGNLLSNRSDLNFGTIHGDDMLLVLKSDVRNNYPWSDSEKKISEKFLEMYENFVKTGIVKFNEIELPSDLGDKLSPPKSLMITNNSV